MIAEAIDWAPMLGGKVATGEKIVIGASKRHLGDTGEGYFQHLKFATKVGAVAIGGGLACFAHALVPALFTNTGSRAIRRLNAMIDDRQQPD